MVAPSFHDLMVHSVTPEAANSVAITLKVPPHLLDTFQFVAGQFITVRASLQGQDVRRSYSLCATPRLLAEQQLIRIGVRAVEGGLMSNWLLRQLRVGQVLSVTPPEGRFVVRRQRARHRVGFAAGSGITPILSILTDTLESDERAKFTLVYGNRRTDSVMFNEALQDLKDRFPNRLSLFHVLSRQAQDIALLQGRIDAAKVHDLIQVLLPVKSMDEVFICGPEAMIEATEAGLRSAGVAADRIFSERFASTHASASTHGSVAPPEHTDPDANIRLSVIADGKRHELKMRANQNILDVALEAGLDLPFSCKGGVCCTCRAKLISGEVAMERNFTLEAEEVNQGFVLSCQARPTSDAVVLSFDER